MNPRIRTASADDVFNAFDNRIEEFLTKGRKGIEQEYKKTAGRPVDDSEIESFIQGLGDTLYESVSPDPAHLKRFVDFYASDDKLQKAVSDLIEKAVEYPPARAASDLRDIAKMIDSGCSLSISVVASAITSVLDGVKKGRLQAR